RALDSSAKFGPSAPAIAHAWHMPGHIYSRLHRYNDAVWQQEASARVDHAHMMRYQIIPDDIHNFAHNNEWLIRNMNHLGQVKRSVELSCNMIELPRLPKLNDKGEYNHNGGSWNYGRQRLRDTLMRFEEWEQLMEFGATDYLKAGAGTINENEWLRIMGIAAFESGDIERGQQLLAELNEDLKSIKAEQDEAVKKAEERNKDKKEAEKKKAVDAEKKKFKSKIDARERVRKELHAYDLANAEEPNAEEAGKAIEAAKTIARARKARLFLKLGNQDKAVELATQDADGAKNQVAALANKIWVLLEAGKEEDAKKDFENLRKIAHVADLDSALIKKIAHLGEGDWRIAEETSKDLGERPDLNSLGPFRWSPPKAPAFTLNNAEDKPVSLSDYTGKPTLVIFFLGRGCTHCMEQLNEFAPMQEKFAAAGIEVVAVSTDNTKGLRATYAGADDEPKNPFPFPLLSDEKLEAFRAFRAYDDFEKIALHGTFLIDGVGRIRWHNISYEPFMHPEFVLKESKRLLSYEDS
ncbi:MAG: redoxin domain-containing protein, partial [Verrucomicrobiota bacterium]